jgi:hypothetical protein
MRAGVLCLVALGCLSLAACTARTNDGEGAASGGGPAASVVTEIFNLAVTGMT